MISNHNHADIDTRECGGKMSVFSSRQESLSSVSQFSREERVPPVDAKEFDDLVTKLTSGPSRRDALKGALGGALAAIGLSADALSKGKNGGKKGRGKGGAGADGKGKGKKSRGPGAQGKGNKGKRRGGLQSEERCKCNQCATTCASGKFSRKRVGKKGKKRVICKCKPYGS
jgi:hypothetical protein